MTGIVAAFKALSLDAKKEAYPQITAAFNAAKDASLLQVVSPFLFEGRLKSAHDSSMQTAKRGGARKNSGPKRGSGRSGRNAIVSCCHHVITI
jgi:hypothetical protein